ncbi:MAG: thermonuclease family protein [Hyphomicrobiales bacterium]
MWPRRRYQPRPLWRSLLDLLAFLALLAALTFVLDYLGILDVRGSNARVKDGDSLVLDGTEVRLWGIDAPELHQTCSGPSGTYACGKEARAALGKLIRGQTITCRIMDRDRYGRSVSVCRGAANEINMDMLRQGWAIAYRNPGFAYLSAEAEAKSARRGIWQGRFERPEDFRARNRLVIGSMLEADD